MFDNLVSSPALSKLLMHKLISPFACELSYLCTKLLVSQITCALGYLRLR